MDHRLYKLWTEALLTNYSGEYETWLEERIEELEEQLRLSIIDVADNEARANDAESQITRAMDALFPEGWEAEDAERLGEIVEGMCKHMDEDDERWIRVVAVIEDIRSKATPEGAIAGLMDALNKALDLGIPNAQETSKM